MALAPRIHASRRPGGAFPSRSANPFSTGQDLQAEIGQTREGPSKNDGLHYSRHIQNMSESRKNRQEAEYPTRGFRFCKSGGVCGARTLGRRAPEPDHSRAVCRDRLHRDVAIPGPMNRSGQLRRARRPGASIGFAAFPPPRHHGLTGWPPGSPQGWPRGSPAAASARRPRPALAGRPGPARVDRCRTGQPGGPPPQANRPAGPSPPPGRTPSCRPPAPIPPERGTGRACARWAGRRRAAGRSRRHFGAGAGRGRWTRPPPPPASYPGRTRPTRVRRETLPAPTARSVATGLPSPFSDMPSSAFVPGRPSDPSTASHRPEAQSRDRAARAWRRRLGGAARRPIGTPRHLATDQSEIRRPNGAPR